MPRKALALTTGIVAPGENLRVERLTDDPSMLLLGDPLYRTASHDVAGIGGWRWNLDVYGLHPGAPSGGSGTNAAGGNMTYLNGGVRWVPFRDMELRGSHAINGARPFYW